VKSGLGEVFGFGEKGDGVEEFGERAGPAVAEDQRGGVGTGRAGVDIVNVVSFDVDGEVVETGRVKGNKGEYRRCEHEQGRGRSRQRGERRERAKRCRRKRKKGGRVSSFHRLKKGRKRTS
jgi:hypothetical protein